MSKNPPLAETLAEADQVTNYLLTTERREAIEAALFSDLDEPSLGEQLERVCDALYWNGIFAIRMSKPARPTSQGMIDFMTAEMRAGHSKTESREALSVMRKRLNRAIALDGDDSAKGPA